MQIEIVDIDSISPDPANCRKHPQRNLRAIEDSLRRFRQQKPIVVDSSGIIRAGNGTWLAAKKLGWKTVAVVRSDLPPAELDAYAVVDNRAAELAEWDVEAMEKLLATLDLGDCGFDESELKALGIAEKDGVELRQIEIQAPPPMSWVVIGIPTVRFGEISQTIEAIALKPGVFCETTVGNGQDQDG